jgi:hypothetical protein
VTVQPIPRTWDWGTQRVCGVKYGVKLFIILADGSHFKPFLFQSGNGALFRLFWYFLNRIFGNPGQIRSRIRYSGSSILILFFAKYSHRKYLQSNLSLIHPAKETMFIIIKNRKSGFISDFALKNPKFRINIDVYEPIFKSKTPAGYSCRIRGCLIFFYHSGEVFPGDAVKIFKNTFSLECVTDFRMPLKPINIFLGKCDRLCITNR